MTRHKSKSKKIITSIVCVLIAGVLGLGIYGAVKQSNKITTPIGSVSTETNTTKTDTVSLEKIAELNRQIGEYAKQVASLNSYITELEQSAEDNEAVINGLREVVTNKTTQIETLQGELATLQAEYDQLQSQYSELQENYEAFSTSGLDIETIIGLFSGEIEELVVPESVNVIRPYAFAGMTLERLVLPESVTAIGANAFEASNITDFYFKTGQSVVSGKLIFHSANIDTLYFECEDLICEEGSWIGANSNFGTVTLKVNNILNLTNGLAQSADKFNEFNINAHDIIVSRYSDFKNDNQDGIVNITCDNLIFDNNSTPSTASAGFLSVSGTANGTDQKTITLTINDSIEIVSGGTKLASNLVHTKLIIKTGPEFTSCFESGTEVFTANSQTATAILELDSLDVLGDGQLFSTSSRYTLGKLVYTGNASTTYFATYMNQIGELYIKDELYEEYVENLEDYSEYTAKIHRISELNAEETENVE